MAALIIAKRIGVVPAEYLEHLLAIPQMYFGDATRTRLAIGDQRLPIGVQVIVGVGPARRRMISFGIAFTIWGTPATKALRVIS